MEDMTQVNLGGQMDAEQKVMIAKRPDGSFIVESQDGEQEAADLNEVLEIVRVSFGGEEDMAGMRAEVAGEVYGKGMQGGMRGMKRGGGM